MLPAAGYAGITGLNPYVIRSNGVLKWRRWSGGSELGPSGGIFTSVLLDVDAKKFVTPSSRVVNPYEPFT